LFTNPLAHRNYTDECKRRLTDVLLIFFYWFRPLALFGKTGALPLSLQGDVSAAHLVAMKWYWTGMVYMAFRGTC